MSEAAGVLTWISGPVVHARVTEPLAMSEQVWVGEERLAGEVIAIDRDRATIQVYEETTGLRPGAALHASGHPLSVSLGPGLLGSVFDGIQRPLATLLAETGIYIRRGVQPAPLPARRWSFTPCVGAGDVVGPGARLGTVPETALIEHRVLVPPFIQGTVIRVLPIRATMGWRM